MPVYARTFIEPSFLQRGIHAYTYEIISSIVEIFRDVVSLCGIAAWLVSQIESVHPDPGITEYAVELQPQMFAIIFFGDREGLSVPSHACLRIFVSDRLVPVAVAGLFLERKVHYPVMRKVHCLPQGSIEFLRIRAFVVDGCCLGQVVEVFCSASEILFRR